MRTPILFLTALVILTAGCATRPAPPQKPAYPPEIIKGKTRYPLLGRLAGMEGTTLIDLKIDKNGKLQRMRFAKSSGSILLDNAALEAASQFTFKPARDKEGRPIPSTVRLPITFAIKPPITSQMSGNLPSR